MIPEIKPEYAISIRQPWAELILQGKKNTEYRVWRLGDQFVGEWLYLHAAKTITFEEKEVMQKNGLAESELIKGAYVGLIKFGKPELKETPKDLVGFFGSKECFYWPILETTRIEPIKAVGKLRVWKV